MKQGQLTAQALPSTCLYNLSLSCSGTVTPCLWLRMRCNDRRHPERLRRQREGINNLHGIPEVHVSIKPC